MGLFNKKEETQENTVDDELKAKADRLASKAGNIIQMLNDCFKTPQGIDIRMSVLYAAGLCGIACHEAVKANNESFVDVGLEDGRTYYFGDAVNKYLLESKLSVMAFVAPVTNMNADEAVSIVKSAADDLGYDKLNVLGFDPEQAYIMVKECWDGIFDNMTDSYCESPDEWPILYSIVLQNLVAMALNAGAPRDEVAKGAFLCAVMLSKMDKESLRAKE